MKCPLACIGDYGRANILANEAFDCLKEECACWSDEHGQCDPTGMLSWLIHIESRLTELLKKMPTEEWFGR